MTPQRRNRGAPPPAVAVAVARAGKQRVDRARAALAASRRRIAVGGRARGAPRGGARA